VLSNGCFVAGLCDGRFHYFAQVHDSPLQGNAARPRVLSLDGYRVDAVQVVSNVMIFGFVDEIPVEQIWPHLFLYPMVCRPDHLYRTGESLDLEFCKTLLASPRAPPRLQFPKSSSVGLHSSTAQTRKRHSLGTVRCCAPPHHFRATT
jgi:hypothetical protein